MHRKYAPDGLVCVSTDYMPGELPFKERVHDFLRRMTAAFPNYIFRDSPDNVAKWEEKYGIEVSPAVLLFDRGGRRVGIPVDADHEAVELAVRKLLAEK